MPGLHHVQVVDCIKMVDSTNVKRKVLDMQRIELFWSKSGTHTLLFLECNVTAAYSICKCANFKLLFFLSN